MSLLDTIIIIGVVTTTVIGLYLIGLALVRVFRRRRY